MYQVVVVLLMPGYMPVREGRPEYPFTLYEAFFRQNVTRNFKKIPWLSYRSVSVT